MNRVLLSITLILFLALTAITLWHHGYIGLFQFQLSSYAGMQVLTDLVIALTLFLIWMWHDAKRYDRSPWPWAIATMTTGSIAPMVYLLIYKTGKTDKPH